MSDEISGARLDDTLDDLDKIAKGEVRAHSDIRAVGEDGAWTVRALRAENARLRGEIGVLNWRLDKERADMAQYRAAYTEIEMACNRFRALECRSPDSVRAALEGQEAPEGFGA